MTSSTFDFVVSTQAGVDNTGPRVAALASGGFVVVWGSVGDQSVPFAQIYDSTGNPVGSIMSLGAPESFPEFNPSVAAVPTGGFIVTWEETSGGDGQPRGRVLRGRVFNEQGEPVGEEFGVPVPVAGSQSLESNVTVLPSGFLVTWQSDTGAGRGRGLDVRGQLFDFNGVAVGSGFQAGLDPANMESSAWVAPLATGGFVLSWYEGGGVPRRGQIYASDGSRVGNEFDMSAGLKGVMAPLSSGGFLVIAGRENEFGAEILGQIHAADGSRIGEPFSVTTAAPRLEAQPDIIVLSTDRFLITWTDTSGQGVDNLGTAIRGQVIDGAGNRIGDEFLVNTTTAGDQFGPDGAMLLSGDLVVTWFEQAARGVGTLRARIVSAPAELLMLTGTDAADTLLGGAGAERILGLPGNDQLSGGAGDDVLDGGTGIDLTDGGVGNDTHLVDAREDIVTERAGEGLDTILTRVNYFLAADSHVEILAAAEVVSGDPIDLYGNVFANELYGNAGRNRLSGGGGGDKLFGFAGDDIYVVNDPTDQIYEAADAGVDLVLTNGSYRLLAGSHVEMVLPSDRAGTADLRITGNELFNILYGNEGANVLESLGGGDGLVGYGGDDTYLISGGNDRIYEVVGAGFDTAVIRAGYRDINYQLAAEASVEIVRFEDRSSISRFDVNGNAGFQIIYGNAGFNVLRSGGGSDGLVGYAGDDIYYVHEGDTVYETEAQGLDTVRAHQSYRLVAGLSIERLEAADPASALSMNLFGNELVNRLTGSAGANYLDGGGSATGDTLLGLSGDDTYYVRSEKDVVLEDQAGGFDTVLTETGYELRPGSWVEIVRLVDAPGMASLNLTGNASFQILYGNAGANVLDGKSGSDGLVGLVGDDVYLVHEGDTIYEFAGEGLDTARARQSYRLVEGVSVERLEVADAAGSEKIHLWGNELANVLTGNAGGTQLDGGRGNDVLTGLAGADDFLFSTALGVDNVDLITDFESGTDRFLLDRRVFAGLNVGALGAGAFNTGRTATDADDRLLYDSTSGALFFDPDGAGGAAAIQFASVTPGTAITSEMFFVV